MLQQVVALTVRRSPTSTGVLAAPIVAGDATPIGLTPAALYQLLLFSARDWPLLPARAAAPREPNRSLRDRRLGHDGPQRPAALAAGRYPEADRRGRHQMEVALGVPISDSPETAESLRFTKEEPQTSGV